jgi:hypothetical protein
MQLQVAKPTAQYSGRGRCVHVLSRDRYLAWSLIHSDSALNGQTRARRMALLLLLLMGMTLRCDAAIVSTHAILQYCNASIGLFSSNGCLL